MILQPEEGESDLAEARGKKIGICSFPERELKLRGEDRGKNVMVSLFLIFKF